MKQIGNKKYYSKKEICERLGIGTWTLNNRIRVTKIDGYYFGRLKYYDDAQIKALLEYRPEKQQSNEQDDSDK